MSAREYFWGVKLTSENKEVVWDPEQEDEEELDIDEGAIQHFLFLKQAVLGKGAKEGERNIVEISADDFDGNTVTQPLLSLKLGLNESTVVDIGAQPPLTLKLISGSGPVFLSGQHALELKDDDFDLMEEEEQEDSPIKMQLASKKRPASDSDAPAKKAKVEKSGDAKPGAKSPQKKTIADLDEDSEDDDEEYAMGVDDPSSGEGGDSEDEESEEESDEESPAKPQAKKSGKVNGAGPKGQQKKHSQKKSDEHSTPSTVEEIKKLVSSAQNLPKKQAKFLNFLRSTYKVQDNKKLNDLWTWYKASQTN